MIFTPPIFFSDDDIGKWIGFKDFNGKVYEFGRLKSFNNDKKSAFVVFKCNGDWDNYFSYTSEKCSYDDIELINLLSPENSWIRNELLKTTKKGMSMFGNGKLLIDGSLINVSDEIEISFNYLNGIQTRSNLKINLLKNIK